MGILALPQFADMPSGVVKKWMDEKGLGFISPDDGGDDVFVHRSVLDGGEEYLEEGDAVTFESEYDDRKGKYKCSSCSKSGGGGGGGGGGKGGGKGGGGKSKGGKGGYSPW